MSTNTNQTSVIGSRKAKHLSICTNPQQFPVEPLRNRLTEQQDSVEPLRPELKALHFEGLHFEGVHFIHEAFPELAQEELDLSVPFLNHPAALPLFISCMTGGSEEGFQANKELARAAQQAGIPVGMGSIRILFEHPELFPHFHLKPLAPDVPVLANLGAVQVRDLDHRLLFEMLGKLEVQGLVVHVNPGQELFQPEGDRDFRGLKEALARLCEHCPLPVIVKETGFGIHPRAVAELFQAGVSYVDLAGAGGTNWVKVESYRLSEEEREVARNFDSWGLPTALLLPLAAEHGPILASGGLRGGMEVAKAIALGAQSAGMALPLIRAVKAGGAEEVLKLIRRVEKTLMAVMILTGSKTIRDLQKGKIWLDSRFSASLVRLKQALAAGESSDPSPPLYHGGASLQDSP